MEIKKGQDYYIMRLDRGEEIIGSLHTAAARHPMRSVFFFGLGVGKDIILGFFDTHNKKYITKAFTGEYEFTSFSGNISCTKKETVVHCHATITDKNFNACGGHLFQAVVPATMEIILFPVSPRLQRRKDRVTGLNLLDLQ
jgi:predicted DNA-binding protein with PD1-like motif